MMIPGIGIGIGFGGAGASPAWLQSRLVARYGARLIDLRFDALEAGGWPGRVGGTAAYSNGAAHFVVDAINDRPAFITNGAQNALAVATSAPCQTAIVVVAASATAATWETWVVGTGTSPRNIITRLAADVIYYNVANHYVDGVSSETVPTNGIHVVEGVSTAGSGITGAAWNNPSNPERFFAGKLGFSALLSDTQSASERADTVTDLQRYYRITV